jgi:lysophospholipase L1-like esterase
MCGTTGLRVDELNASPYLVDQVKQFVPDVMLLHIGTNDCTQLQSGGSPTLATTRANLTTLLNNIRTNAPACVVFICRIIDNNTAGAEVAAFNTNAIDTDVVARSDYASGLVKVVDMFTAVGAYSATNYSDNTHPNNAGYALMTTAWQTAFNAVY